jgi:FG-GAP repeat protein
MRSGMVRASALAIAWFGMLGACGNEDMFALGREQRDIRQFVRARIVSADQRLYEAIVVGDLDGDGIADAIVSASAADGDPGARPDLVTKYVLYGGDLTGEIDIATLPSLLRGPYPMGGWGDVITPIGDVDGDGLADVLIQHTPGPACASHDPSIPDEARHAGSYLLYGSAARLTGATQLADAAVLLRDPRPCALQSVERARLGDLDGDGKDDFAIGVQNQMFVFYGRGERWSGTVDVAAAADAVIDTSIGLLQTGDFGTAGDVDGDGYDDFLVNAITSDREHAVGLVRGGPARLAGVHSLDEIVATTFEGDGICPWNPGVGLGDLDRDGHGDLAILRCRPFEDPFAFHVFYGRGGGFPAHVQVDAADAAVRGSSPEASNSVFPLLSGDLDGDGARDLILGDPGIDGGDGGVYVVPGRAGRWSGDLPLGATATVYLNTHRPAPCTAADLDAGAACGIPDHVASATSAGDVTGDHRVDLLVTDGSRPSTVYLVSPAAPKP